MSLFGPNSLYVSKSVSESLTEDNRTSQVSDGCFPCIKLDSELHYHSYIIHILPFLSFCRLNCQNISL